MINLKYAGVSVSCKGKESKVAFHTSKSDSVSVFVPLPETEGEHTEFAIQFVKLPENSDRESALRFLLSRPDFDQPKIKSFLQEQIGKITKGNSLQKQIAIESLKEGLE